MVTMTGAIVRAYRWWLVPAAKDAQRQSKGSHYLQREAVVVWPRHNWGGKSSADGGTERCQPRGGEKKGKNHNMKEKKTHLFRHRNT